MFVPGAGSASRLRAGGLVCLAAGAVSRQADFRQTEFERIKHKKSNIRTMKRNRLFPKAALAAAAGLSALLPLAGNAQVAIDETNFPDELFRAYVQENFDTDQDGSLSDAECGKVEVINVGGPYDPEPRPYSGLSDLTGIEHFPALEDLYCEGTGITALDLSQNPALLLLNCSETGITSLDLSHCPALESLYCIDSKLTALDVSHNAALVRLDFGGMGITSLDLSQNPALETLQCYGSGLTSLDLSQNPALSFLYYVNSPALTDLHLDGASALKNLVCDNTGLTSLDVSQNPALKELSCSYTGITNLDVSQNPDLEWLCCNNTGITSLDLSQNPALKVLRCHFTELTSLDVSQNPALTGLEVSNAKLSHIDLSQNPALQTVDLQGNVHPVDAEVGGTYDLSRIPGFDLSRVTWLQEPELEGSLLRFSTEIIPYFYDTRLGGGENKVVFSLRAVPGLGNEPGMPESAATASQPFRAHTENGVLHVENARSLVEVFNLQGRRVYAGPESRIPLPSQGVYIVRNQGRSLKVANL